jgi:hypothetical protein
LLRPVDYDSGDAILGSGDGYRLFVGFVLHIPLRSACCEHPVDAGVCTAADPRRLVRGALSFGSTFAENNWNH